MSNKLRVNINSNEDVNAWFEVRAKAPHLSRPIRFNIIRRASEEQPEIIHQLEVTGIAFGTPKPGSVPFTLEITNNKPYGNYKAIDFTVEITNEYVNGGSTYYNVDANPAKFYVSGECIPKNLELSEIPIGTSTNIEFPSGGPTNPWTQQSYTLPSTQLL